MKRPGYREAVDWLAQNDDCHWIGDYDGHGPMLSVAASMTRDLYDVNDARIIADLKKALARIYPDHPAITSST